MAEYAKPLPKDQYGSNMQEYPAPFTALQRVSNENGTVSSFFGLTDLTTVLEVATANTVAVIKWIATTDTTASVISAAGTANYDNIIPPNSYRRFVVPIERNPGTASIQGINRQLGLYQRVAIKTAGIGSVLTAEF